MKTKKCGKCKEVKLISEFHKIYKNNEKRQSLCKECHKKSHKEYYKNNPKKSREKSRKYYQNNSEKVKEKNRKRRKDNPIKQWCQTTIYHHKQRGFKVLLKTTELYEVAKNIHNCPICNCKLDWKWGTGRNYNSPSLDRINNQKFLSKSNVQIICDKCNSTKQDRTLKEIYKWCFKFIKYYIFRRLKC